MSLYYQSACQLLNQLKTKSISSQDILNQYLARIEQVNPQLNAVVAQDIPSALARAKKADEVISKGHSIGPLHGLPITIKDLCEVKGYPSTYGTLGKKNHIAKTTATAVKLLQDAGAIIVGMTNSPELATAFETDNLVYGKTNNPYDFDRTPGGSSGGESAIIAAGGCAFGLGSDGGGSIRLPAHFCGITGIKPTRGLISVQGIDLPLRGMGLLNPFGTLGPMARYVEDLELMLNPLSCYDFNDPNSVPVTLPPSSSVDRSKLRIGLYTDNGISKVDDKIAQAVQDCASYLSTLGCDVKEVRPPAIEESFDLLWNSFFAIGDNGHSLREQMKDVGSTEVSAIRRRFMEDCSKVYFDTPEMLDRMRRIAIFKRGFHLFMNDYDILLCPPAATCAKPHGKTFDELKDMSYTMTYNLLGWPAGVVRVSENQDNLPIGVQVVARPYKEHQIFSVMKCFEEKFGGFVPSKIIPS